MSKKRKIVTIIVAAVAALTLAGGAFWYFALSGGDGSDSAVYVQAVSDLNWAATSGVNRYSGVVESQKTEDIKLDSSRTVAEVLVAEGDVVQAGTPLFTYDIQSTQLQIEQAQLEIERLNLNIKNSNDQIAQLQKEQSAASADNKLAYAAEIQELQATVASAQYDIKSKQAEIEKMQNLVENATVTATIDGTVQTVSDAEQMAASGSDVFISILASGDLRVKGSANEQTIQELYEGMTVIMRSRVDDSLTWTGTLSTIDTSSTEENSNEMYYSSSGESASKYAFYVELDSTDGLMMGQHLTIEPDFGQSEAKTGIWLDSGWIVTDEDGNSYIWAQDNNERLEKRTVTLGGYDETMDIYEIASGLESDDYIAWPDENCVSGAATTYEYIVDESFTEDSYTEDSYTEDSYTEDSYTEDGYTEDGYSDDMAADGDMPADAIGGVDSAMAVG